MSWAGTSHRGTKIHNSKKVKKTIVMAPINSRCDIRTKIDTKDVHITSLFECLRRYIVNRKIIILVGTVLEV